MLERQIAAIPIGQRHRRVLGDLNSLAASIAELGLLHPVVITSDDKLIAGERQIRACELLGWKSVPVSVVNLDNAAEGWVATEGLTHAPRAFFRPDAAPRAAERLSGEAHLIAHRAGRMPASNGGMTMNGREALDRIVRDYEQKIRTLTEQNSNAVDRAACIYSFNATFVREYREAYPPMLPELMLRIASLTSTAIICPELLYDEGAPVVRP